MKPKEYQCKESDYFILNLDYFIKKYYTAKLKKTQKFLGAITFIRFSWNKLQLFQVLWTKSLNERKITLEILYTQPW